MSRAKSAAISCYVVLAGVLPLILLAGACSAAERDERAAASAASAQAFLARLQREDGSFAGDAPAVPTTASALLAFIASGNIPDAGRYGLLVRRAGDFLLKSIPEDGNIARIDPTGMRGHCIVTLTLAEAFAVETDAQQRTRIRAALNRLVGVMMRATEIKRAETDAGGVGVDVSAPGSDLMTTAGFVLALRAANNVGVAVPKSVFEGAVGYIRRCALPGGGFADRPGGDASAAAAYAGILVLSLIDPSDSAELIARGRDLIVRPADAAITLDASFFQLQAIRLLANSPWITVWPAERDRVIAMQTADGSVAPRADAAESARIYPTASALLVLSVPRRLLMAFEK